MHASRGKSLVDAEHASHLAQQASLSPQFHGRFMAASWSPVYFFLRQASALWSRGLASSVWKRRSVRRFLQTRPASQNLSKRSGRPEALKKEDTVPVYHWQVENRRYCVPYVCRWDKARGRSLAVLPLALLLAYPGEKPTPTIPQASTTRHITARIGVAYSVECGSFDPVIRPPSGTTRERDSLD